MKVNIKCWQISKLFTVFWNQLFKLLAKFVFWMSIFHFYTCVSAWMNMGNCCSLRWRHTRLYTCVKAKDILIVDCKTLLFDLMNNFQMYRHLVLIFVFVRLFDCIEFCQAVFLYFLCLVVVVKFFYSCWYTIVWYMHLQNWMFSFTERVVPLLAWTQVSILLETF